MPILTLITFTPILGILCLLFIPKTKEQLIRIIATVFSAIPLVLCILLMFAYDYSNGNMQFVERVTWIKAFNIHYFLGIDGISLPMIALTTLLSFLACIASYKIKGRQKEYFILYLLLVTGMIGTFLALDLFLFYVFWEVVLVPMYFLIGIWGGPRKEYAAMKFFLYTLAGSVFMLLGFLALYFTSDPHTFDMLELARGSGRFVLGFQQVVFIAIFLGFAIKVPIFPFHTWLPDAHVEAPTPISVILAGVLLKMGCYGFFRISYPILPDAAQWFSYPLAILGVVNIVYGAFVALSQVDFKKMVAYSSISHMGFVLLGLASMTSTGINGALMQMFNHGVITGGMFLLVGVLYDRTHTRDLKNFGGLGAQVPVYGGFLILFTMGSLGLPGLSGFVGEFMALLGTFPVFRVVTILAVMGIVVAAAYHLKMLQRVLLGPLNQRWKDMKDISVSEIITLVPLMILVVLIGIYPMILLDIQVPAITELLAKIKGLLL